MRFCKNHALSQSLQGVPPEPKLQEARQADAEVGREQALALGALD